MNILLKTTLSGLAVLSALAALSASAQQTRVPPPRNEKLEAYMAASARQAKLEADLHVAVRRGLFKQVERLLASATNGRSMSGGWFWKEALQSRETNTVRLIHERLGIAWESFFNDGETVSTNDLTLIQRSLPKDVWETTRWEVAKWLVLLGMTSELDHMLAQGLPLIDREKSNPEYGYDHDLLGMSLASRDRHLFERLLGKGADPDNPPRRQALLHEALRGGQMYALRALNPPDPLATLLRECLGRFSPQTNSPFVGIWSCLKQGFGSFSFHLEADGTGWYATDWGGMIFFWEDQTNHVACYQILPEAMWRDPWSQLQTNGLVLVSTNALRLMKDPSTASLYVTNRSERIVLQRMGK